MTNYDSISLLIIEKNEKWIPFFIETLQSSDFLPKLGGIAKTASLENALQILNKQSFDLILVNLFLSDSQGVETFLEIYKMAPDAPILVVIDEGHETLAYDSISLGAQEFITHQEKDSHILAHLVRSALERNNQRLALRSLIFLDELTEIYNRRGFMTLAEQQLEIGKRLKKGCYLFLLDVDKLKDINDHFGHAEGDIALIHTAQIIKNSFRSSDVLGRIGGDEFAVVAIGDGEDYENNLLQNLYKNLDLFHREMEGKSPYQLSFSVGKAYSPASSEKTTLTYLLEEADKTLYQAKNLKVVRHL